MKKFYLVTLLSLIATPVLAEVLATSLIEEESITKSNEHKWCNSSYVGYAWSMKSGLVNPDITKFNQVAAGDTDDAPLSNVSYAGISLGRRVFKWLTASFSYEIFNGFNYQSYHKNGTLAGNPTTSVDFLRTFSLIHQSALLNFYIDFPSSWQTTVGNINISPELGGGLGVGVNQLNNFQTLTFANVTPTVALTTLGLLNIKTSLAWFVNIGISFQPKGTDANFGFGYRYYNGGKFSTSSKYILNDVNDQSIVDLAAWTGTIRTNQFKLFLDFDF